MVSLYLAVIEIRRMHLRSLREAADLDQEVRERRRIEQELRASEEKYRAVIETSADGFTTIDREGRLLEVNDAYVRLSGYCREELLTMRIEDLEVKESPEESKAHCLGIIQSENDVFETLHRSKNGTVWQAEISTSFCPIGQGQFFAFIRDIRQRKRSDSLLRERLELSTFADQASLDELVQKALVAAEIHTESLISFFHFIDPDQENVSLQTWSPNTLDGKCNVEVMKRHYPISQAGVWVDCFHTREPVIHNDYNTLPQRKGLPPGHTPIVREMAVPILREDRVVAIFGVGNKQEDYTQDDVEVVQIIASFVTDLVTRKQAEEALRQSEERYRALVETSYDWVWEVDTQGKYIYVSPKGEAFLGYPASGILGNTPFKFMPDDEARRVKEIFSDLAERQQPIIGLENVNRHRDGHLIVLETTAIPHYGIDGMFLGYRGTDRDITERKQAEEDRLEMERRLLHAQKLESLGVLAGGIAHDFNNLLMAILGNLELVLLEISPSFPGRTGIEQAIQATRRATDLTRQMLAYSGRGHFMVSRIDLSELVRENAELFRTAITRTVSLNVSLNPRVSTIEADPGQIQQVIMNLLTNAVEAMEGKTGVVTLFTGVEEFDEEYLAQSRLAEKPKPGTFTYLEVSDMGCGMNAQTQLRLFDPFFTTKFTGRGLGMSALLGIVRGHKGAIFVDSELGVGTTIRVLFPTCEDEPVEPVIEVPAPPREIPGEILTGRVLVVDDDINVRQLCQKLVKRLGYEVVCAADGEEALKVFTEEGDTIACVLLDLTMPRMDGLSTFRAMKEVRPDVRVILSSGYSEHESIARFSGEGLSGFLQKPFNIKELGKRLAEIMGT